ncbi:hypothetical protein B6U74_04885 [Candidatus Bathyarchaeota archaeon ex4484_205]|nr:MAG: hypothetical protein B6U74_04885 [Candidatus Bathyarchaeota archaeon ex4484_205]RLF96337.1 MAG: hypothetical protein DRN52_02590 [Thermococci archaeon]
MSLTIKKLIVGEIEEKIKKMAEELEEVRKNIKLLENRISEILDEIKRIEDAKADRMELEKVRRIAFGLNPTDLKILESLKGERELSLDEISEEIMGLEKNYILSRINRLIDLGYIEKTKEKEKKLEKFRLTREASLVIK